MQWSFVKRSWAWLLSGVLLGGACAAVLVVHGSFARGMVVGAAIVLVFGGIAVVVMQLTGAAPLAMGAHAEVWTASELRPLRRHGWRIANHLLLRFGDVDHLLVGRHGVLVIETKWSADTWTLDSDRVRKALLQVQRNAHDIRIWRPELRHGSPAVVRPVLFLWGGARSEAPKPDHVEIINGVHVIYGLTAARRWRDDVIERTATPELSDEQVTAIWEAVKANAHKLDQREQREPPPPSIASLYLVGMSTFLTATLAILACLYSFEAVTPAWARVTIAAGYTAIGLLARRWKPTRTIALGWLTGTGFTAAFAIAVTPTG